MDTKLKGDIAEQAVALEALKRGWVRITDHLRAAQYKDAWESLNAG